MNNVSVPDIKTRNPHWKVGDNMGNGPLDPNGFGIAQIAIVQTKTGGHYDIEFFDSSGKRRGSIKVKVRDAEV